MSGRDRRAVDLVEVTGLKYSQALKIVRGEAGLLQNTPDSVCLGAAQLRAANICRPSFDFSYPCMCDECLK